MRTYYFVYLLVFLSTTRGLTRMNVRQVYARGIPVRNRRVDVTPLTTLTVGALTTCVGECMATPGCKAFNYAEKTCELLNTYLCEKIVNQLVAAPGFTYYDVEDELTFKDIGVRDGRTSCQMFGKCSPKCPCEYTSDFTTIVGYYVAGYTQETATLVTLEQCQQRCVDATGFVCTSADYSVAFQVCYLSDVTHEDAPGAYMTGPYTYTYRTCQ